MALSENEMALLCLKVAKRWRPEMFPLLKREMVRLCDRFGKHGVKKVQRERQRILEHIAEILLMAEKSGVKILLAERCVVSDQMLDQAMLVRSKGGSLLDILQNMLENL